MVPGSKPQEGPGGQAGPRARTSASHPAASGGAGGLDKAAFARKLAGLGADLHAETTRDWSMVQAKGPLAAAPALLALAADELLRPALPASELEVARTQQLIALKQLQEDPDGRLRALLDEVRFQGHPYAVRPEGTAATVKAFTQAQLAAHLGTLREQSRLVLVVVSAVDTGDWRFRARLAEQVKAVTAGDLQAFARRYFGNLQVVLLGDPSTLDPAAATAL
jgi:predicted Zn-dependent peptidase